MREGRRNFDFNFSFTSASEDLPGLAQGLAPALVALS
jgi:hypothetical protein